jgi:hypothetical protein
VKVARTVLNGRCPVVTRASTPTQWNFKAYYLYGAVAPQTGESFWLEFSHLDGMCFQIFLDQLAKTYPTHLNVIQLDNGKFPQSSRLKIQIIFY